MCQPEFRLYIVLIGVQHIGCGSAGFSGGVEWSFKSASTMPNIVVAKSSKVVTKPNIVIAGRCVRRRSRKGN